MTNNKVPRHIAIIMDGNRRWAKKHRLSVLKGHDYAAKKVLENIVEEAARRGVKFITLWVFSTENWQRNKTEVAGLLNIFRWGLQERVQRFVEKGVKLKVIGDISRFPQDIQKGIEEAIEKTKNGKNVTVVLAINYGGRDEIIRAVNHIFFSRHSGERQRLQNRFWTSQNDPITEEEFSRLLDTTDIPDPDLLIRTGGEKRLSGFLPWQTVYTELYFTDTLWPDFTPRDLDQAIEEFQKRERRFGK